jgi:hypothetical protein
MAGTDVRLNTTPRPVSPISPTEALKWVLSQNPNRPIHDAVQDLNEWARRNRVQLWCNGNLVPPHFIVTSLQMVARTEADGRPQVDVVPAGPGVGWDPKVYNFELDDDEVRVLLPQLESSPRPSSAALAETLEGTERWVFEQMCANPQREGDRDYVRRLFKRRPDKAIDLKTIQNYASSARKTLREILK